MDYVHFVTFVKEIGMTIKQTYRFNEKSRHLIRIIIISAKEQRMVPLMIVLWMRINNSIVTSLTNGECLYSLFVNIDNDFDAFVLNEVRWCFGNLWTLCPWS